MYGWIDLEVARQRREDLLCEAREWRRAPVAGRTVETGREQTTPVRLLSRILRPERNGWLAVRKKPGAPIHECSAD